jgi:hypothetical protein
MQPPNRGFNRVAWLLPYGVAVLALLGMPPRRGAGRGAKSRARRGVDRSRARRAPRR